MNKSITLFMWGYQHYFQWEIEYLMTDVMGKLGVQEANAECFLLGAKIPDRKNPNDVCVEPEDGKWPIDLFDALLDVIETEVSDHPLQNMHYTDEPSVRDQTERIRRDSVRRAVQKILADYDTEHSVSSFVGKPAPVGDYYVTPVLQLPDKLFGRFRPLRGPISDGYGTGPPSLIHAAVSEVLAEAHDELLRPDPGRGLTKRRRSPEELIRQAATSFMHTPMIAIGVKASGYPDIFEQFNSISSLLYEGSKGTGRLLLADPEGSCVNIHLKFSEPVPFSAPRWSRKILQMASSETALIADCEKVFGLGGLAENINPWASQNVFEVKFLDRYHWRFSCGDEIMLISKYNVPSLPQEEVSRERFLNTYKRLFPRAKNEDVAHFDSLFRAATQQHHGSMLIVAEDAKTEADRLQGQGTKIKPTKMTPALYRQVSGIDGSIIIDPCGICHAIGVILDGPVQLEGSPSRGARYNSGIQYVGASETSRLAIIISDDQTVDVLPEFRPQIKRSAIERSITELETATQDNYHPAINWLDCHRFYLNQEQCDRVNAVLEKIQRDLPKTGEIMIVWEKFTPYHDLDDSYFISESTGSSAS